jgi:hypothetical protein
VGGEAEPSAIDQLFQVSEFVVPTELRDEPSSFAQILREPLDNSLEGVTGAYETTPEPDQDEQVEQDVAVQLEDQLPAMSAGDATIASVEFVVPQTIDAQEVMPSCEPEEFVIEDTYAVIDRISESSAPHRLAAPVLPEMLPRPAACTPTEPSTQPTCTLPEEQQILDMVREMSAEVQQARNESPIENSLESEPAPVDSTPSFQSLREAMAWQFDVVEPESEAPAADPVEAPGSKDEARQSEEPGESSDPVQERRYAQLFTRLQKQRRRVEAVMNRERRPNNEARIS